MWKQWRVFHKENHLKTELIWSSQKNIEYQISHLQKLDVSGWGVLKQQVTVNMTQHIPFPEPPTASSSSLTMNKEDDKWECSLKKEEEKRECSLKIPRKKKRKECTHWKTMKRKESVNWKNLKRIKEKRVLTENI